MAQYRLADGDTAVFREQRGALYSDRKPDENAEALLDDVDGDLYVVGDRSAETLLEAGGHPNIVVIDGATHRQTYDSDIELENYTLIKAQNPQGVVSDAADAAVRDGIEDPPACIDIDGEEDLLALSVVRYVETGSYLVYGDPGIDGDEGIRLLEIDSKLKDEVDRLLQD